MQKVALVVEREVGHAPFKGQQGVGNDLLVSHDALAVRDVDLHLLDLPLQFVLLLGQLLRFGQRILTEALQWNVDNGLALRRVNREGSALGAERYIWQITSEGLDVSKELSKFISEWRRKLRIRDVAGWR